MADYDNLLKIKMESFFGRSIQTITDAKKLVTDINKVTYESVGYQTIRRYWGMVPATTKVSISIKSIFARYVGYADYPDFCAKVQNDDSGKEELNFDFINQLFLQNKSTSIVDYHDWNEAMVEVMVMYIYAKQSVFELFVEKLHKNKAAVQYVIANYQCYHLLNEDWYVKGLLRCCEFAVVEHHRIYGWSMIGIGQMFREDYSGLKQTLDKVKNPIIHVRQKYGIVYPLEGALLGLRIVVDSALYSGKNQMSIFEELASLYATYKNKVFENVLTFSSLVRTCVEVLVWAGLYYEARYIIDIYGIDENYKKRFINRALDPVQQIQLAVIYAQTGLEEKAKKFYNVIVLDHIRFDRKPLSVLLYKMLTLKFLPKTSAKKRILIEKEILDVIEKHNYFIFSKQLNAFIL